MIWRILSLFILKRMRKPVQERMLRVLLRDFLIRRSVSHLERSQKLLFKTMGKCKGGAADVFWTWLISAPPPVMDSSPCTWVLSNWLSQMLLQWLDEVVSGPQPWRATVGRGLPKTVGARQDIVECWGSNLCSAKLQTEPLP